MSNNMDKDWAAYKAKMTNPALNEAGAYKAGFLAGQTYPTKEIAKVIWLAAAYHAQNPGEADFETTYRQLMEK